MSLGSWLTERTAGNGGRVVAGAVYGLGAGRLLSRALHRAQARAGGLGDGWERGVVSLSFDVDYPEDVQALGGLLERLERLGLRASFAVVGRLVEIYPAEHRLIVQAGHELVNHTYSHPDNEFLHPDERFDELAPGSQREQVERCHQACLELLGVAPAGFRAPHFGNVRGSGFYGILAELGYRWSSSTVAWRGGKLGLPFAAADGVLELPVSCCPQHPFAVLDSWHALRRERHAAPGGFAALVREAAGLTAGSRGHLNLYLDPRDVREFEQVRQVLETVREMADRLEPLTMGELAGRLGQTDPGIEPRPQGSR